MRHVCRLCTFMARHKIGVTAAFVLNAIHPFVHGTPLDGGTLDAILLYVTAWGLSE